MLCFCHLCPHDVIGSDKCVQCVVLGAGGDDFPVSATAGVPDLVVQAPCAGFAPGAPRAPETRVLLSVSKAGCVLPFLL